MNPKIVTPEMFDIADKARLIRENPEMAEKMLAEAKG